MKQSFFLWGECLGSRDIPATWASDPNSGARGAHFRHTNLAYCCPVCGEVWGRVWHEKAVPWWQFEQRHCNKHPDKGLSLLGWVDWARGSFMSRFPEIQSPLNFAADWPDAAVKHEFHLLLSKLDKEQCNDNAS